MCNISAKAPGLKLTAPQQLIFIKVYHKERNISVHRPLVAPRPRTEKKYKTLSQRSDAPENGEKKGFTLSVVLSLTPSTTNKQPGTFYTSSLTLKNTAFSRVAWRERVKSLLPSSEFSTENITSHLCQFFFSQLLFLVRHLQF